MKGCIALQSNYAKIGHAVALRLRDHYGVQEFCAYVFSRRAKKFVDEQTDITYTRLLVDHEVHERFHDEIVDEAYLRAMEERYEDSTFWSSIYPDRCIMMSAESMDQQTMKLKPLYAYDDIRKILQIRVRETIAFLETERPDFIVFFALGVIGNMLLYTIAKKMGIKVLVMDLGRIGRSMAISEDQNTITGVKELFDQICVGKHVSPHKEEARQILASVRKNKSVQLAYTTPKNKLPKVTLARRFQVYSIIIRTHWSERKFSIYQRPSSLWRLIKFRLLGAWRKFRGYAEFYTAPDWSKDFAFFPLQCEPELSLLNIAPFYTDQFMVIQAIARSLPINMLLYVKEHPVMLYRRKRSYYKQLLAIPNVRLIDASIKGTTLIEYAKLVATTTGTAGWEAMLFGKPVITFGHVFFNDFPSVTRCTILHELPALVKRKLAEHAPTDESLVDFLSALLDNDVVDFPYFLLEVASPQDVKKDPGLLAFADLVAKKIGLSSHATVSSSS